MTTFQKINRRRWPIWARMTLLAVAAAMVVVLILPTVVESEHGGENLDPEAPVALPHVGGDAVEDCGFAESFEGGAFSTAAYAFTTNPSNDEDQPIDVVDANGVALGDWTVEVTNVSKTSFDWHLFDAGTPVEYDTGLGAPEGKNVSHVAFCLRAVDDGYSVIAVEVKGSKDTNHYLYIPEYNCAETQQFSDEYSVTFNCIDKETIRALFSQFDTNGDGNADTVALITFGTGQAFYVEYFRFEAQAAADLAAVVPFTLMSDDTDPQIGDDPVVTPQCLFNPDPPIAPATSGPGDGTVDVATAGGALPAGATTCYFLAEFQQDENGLWAPFYGLLNLGDGWRTIY